MPVPLHAASLPITWARFVQLEDDDRRELVDGELLEIDVPTKKHEWIVARLIWFLTSWAEPRRAGIVLGSGYKVRIDDHRGVMPDVQFTRSGREGLLDDEGMTRGAPDLAVEVVSPSSGRFDRVQKLAWYAAIGVGEYWIVDPDIETSERRVLGSDKRFVLSTVSGDEVFAPETFVGLEIPLADLWRGPTPF